MTLEEAIAHAKEISENQYICEECQKEHRQLADWLEELKSLREKSKWIPCSERLPKNEEYVLVSFENEGVTIPDIATYEVDKQGNGVFYPSDCNATYASCGVFVNAWMPLPKPYKEKKDGN